jgi:two-component system response regulator MprA
MAILTRILLVDDEPEFADFVRRGLTYEGYTVQAVYPASDGWEAILAEPPNLVILDVMLPDLDGMALCRALRQEGLQVPILMLTARDAVPDRVAGLDAGADDYLPKPFAFEELLARVRALLRRFGSEEAEVLTFADLSLDAGLREARRGERRIHLSPKEYALLELFLHHPRQVLTREVIFARVWGYDYEAESNVLDVYVRRLRRKLGEPDLIETVHGLGYVLRGSGD